MPDDAGIHLTRTDENAAGIDALAALLGGRVGLDAVLSDLNRRGRRGLAPGRAVARALTWDREDRRTTRWWPQGISTSADASESEDVAGRRLLVVSWYAQRAPGEHDHPGSRLTFLDLASRRYRHVLLVVPEVADDGTVRLGPLRVHAGGLVWCGAWLHVAATSRGLMTCHLDDLVRVPDRLAGDPTRLGVDGGRVSSYGYRYLLPVRFAYRAHAGAADEGLRYSFLSLDRGASPPELVVGEYARHDQTRRLARFALERDSLLLAQDEEGRSRPLVLDDGGVLQTQGAVVADGTYYLTVSRGRSTPGSVHVGRPGALRRHRWAAPMGPEDIAYWPSTDLLWSLTEHPRRRWVFSMRRSWFGS
ncbi:MAG: hypothetical protein JWO76_1456 [Nocardioides sp.]|nr:hypothetical protein [Nocardioides sp.]